MRGLSLPADSRKEPDIQRTKLRIPQPDQAVGLEAQCRRLSAKASERVAIVGRRQRSVPAPVPQLISPPGAFEGRPRLYRIRVHEGDVGVREGELRSKLDSTPEEGSPHDKAAA